VQERLAGEVVARLAAEHNTRPDPAGPSNRFCSSRCCLRSADNHDDSDNHDAIDNDLEITNMMMKK
jgi:hypothetical protein